jgi:hypothetical protein
MTILLALNVSVSVCGVHDYDDPVLCCLSAFDHCFEGLSSVSRFVDFPFHDF